MSGESPHRVLLCHTQSTTTAQGLHMIPALCRAMCPPGDASAPSAQGCMGSCIALRHVHSRERGAIVSITSLPLYLRDSRKKKENRKRGGPSVQNIPVLLRCNAFPLRKMHSRRGKHSFSFIQLSLRKLHFTEEASPLSPSLAVD